MEHTTLLRIYLPSGLRLHKTGISKYFAPLLSHHLLRLAKKQNFPQAIVQTISAGYVQHHPLSYTHSELPGKHHPVCVEIAGDSVQLAQFREKHRDILQGHSCLIIKGQ